MPTIIGSKLTLCLLDVSMQLLHLFALVLLLVASVLYCWRHLSVQIEQVGAHNTYTAFSSIWVCIVMPIICT